MTGTYIKTLISGLGWIQTPKKDGVQPCNIRTFKNGGSVAEARMFTGGWFVAVKFDPALIGNDSMAIVGGQEVYFEGHFCKDEYTKKGETQKSYFCYVRITKLVADADELVSSKLPLQKAALQAEAADIQARIKALG
jgi:hypothetical protein